jgi:arabinose-5-phosphate isomerase
MPSACASDLRRLFETQRQYVSHFFEEVAYGSLRDFCQEVADCDGTVYFSGVGKSGFVAQKVSATMVSTGAKSAWLDPTDALRGDVGVLRANDVLVLFSKSGASDELRRLVPLARAKGARVVGVTSDERSALANDADTHVTLPLERELCPFDLAPVTSCAIQMLFGDTCAVAAMRARRAVRDTNDALPPPKENERADPAGARDAPRVADVMHALDETEMLKSAPTCGSEELLVDVLVRLSSGGYGCVLVADRKDRKDRKETLELVGVFTDGDLRRRLGAEKTMCMRRRMAELCSRRCRTISRDASAADAARAMAPENGAKVSFLPVTQDEHSKTLVGIVTLNALVKAGL